MRPAGSSAITRGLAGFVVLGLNSHAGSQTKLPDWNSTTSTSTLRRGVRNNMAAPVLGRGGSSSSRFSGVIGTCAGRLDFRIVKGVSLLNVRTTLPDSATQSVVSGSTLVGGSSVTGVASFFNQRLNQL